LGIAFFLIGVLFPQFGTRAVLEQVSFVFILATFFIDFASSMVNWASSWVKVVEEAVHVESSGSVSVFIIVSVESSY
jgi:hypothetical protein